MSTKSRSFGSKNKSFNKNGFLALIYCKNVFVFHLGVSNGTMTFENRKQLKTK